MPQKNKNTVPILEKALDVMEYIAASENAVSLPELQRNIEISQSSCYRIASTLLERGWLQKCSGNRFDIAPVVAHVGEKTRFQLIRYKRLQAPMNRLANLVGFSAKFSVLDQEEFVNVCSAQCRSRLLVFSAPGFRSSLRDVASVSTIFLTEFSDSDRQRLLSDKMRSSFEKLSSRYLEKGYCFVPGQNGKNAEYPFDTLSVPVRDENKNLLGVISFLSLPGELKENLEKTFTLVRNSIGGIVNCL